LPFVGFSRIWLCLPTLASILLIQLSDARSPYFHFHAPLVPILFWAAADGVGRIGSLAGWWTRRQARSGVANESNGKAAAWSLAAARLAAGCALASGFFYGKSPLSLAFYDRDAGLRGYWQILYRADGIVEMQLRTMQQAFPLLTGNELDRFIAIGRARSFDRLYPLIPQDSSVAATDFVRTRFTHHRECHQYGEGGLKPHVRPDQVDYIIIDLLGPYSNWLGGQQLREVVEQPDRWEVMRWDPDGHLFFHVLRAKR
jgi:hypothetical protein